MIDIRWIDDLLISNTSEQWLKVAMVIGKTMIERGPELSEIDDVILVERIKQLAKDGKIESRGDLNSIRHSEIRLTL